MLSTALPAYLHVTNDNKDNNDGSLSAASAACIQELIRELDAIRKDKAKMRTRPSGLHLFSLQHFSLLSSVCPPRSFHSFSSSRFSHSASRASCDPPCCSQPTITRVGDGTAGKAQEGCPGQQGQEPTQSRLGECGATSHLEKLTINGKIRDIAIKYGCSLCKPWGSFSDAVRAALTYQAHRDAEMQSQQERHRAPVANDLPGSWTKQGHKQTKCPQEGCGGGRGRLWLW